MPNVSKNYKICPTCGGTGKDKKRMLIGGPIVIIIGLLCVLVLKLESYMNMVVFFAAATAFTLYSNCRTCKGKKKISTDADRKR